MRNNGVIGERKWEGMGERKARTSGMHGEKSQIKRESGWNRNHKNVYATEASNMKQKW